MDHSERDRLIQRLVKKALALPRESLEQQYGEWEKEHGQALVAVVRAKVRVTHLTLDTFTERGFDTYTIVPGSAPSTSKTDLRLPTVGGYIVQELIGAGGNGAVFRAVNKATPSIVRAIKIILPWKADPRAIDRLKSEAVILDRLLNKHIVRLHDVGQFGDGDGVTGLPYLVMDLIEGESVTLAAARLQASWRQRIELLRQVLEGLAAAHGQGIAHYDLKPGNILVDAAAGVTIVDFGLAMDTKNGSTVPEGWTYEYAPPEQIDEKDRRAGLPSDVYSFGVLAYELLAGTLPFSFQTAVLAERVRLLRASKPPSLPGITTSIERKVDQVLRNAMQPLVEDRYPNAAELRADFENALRGRLVSNERRTLCAVGRSFYADHKRPVQVATAIGMTLVIGIIGTTWQMVIANEQRQLAVDRQKEAEVATGSMSRALEFLRETLFDLDTYRTGSNVPDLRYVFEAAERRLASLEGDRLAKATVLQALGRVAANRELYDLGVRFLEESSILWEKLSNEAGVKPEDRKQRVAQQAKSLNWQAWAMSEGDRAKKLTGVGQRSVTVAAKALAIMKETHGLKNEDTLAYWADLARLRQLHGGALGVVAAISEYLNCVSAAMGYESTQEFTEALRETARQSAELVHEGQVAEAKSVVQVFIKPLTEGPYGRLKLRVAWSMSQMSEEMVGKTSLVKGMLLPDMSEQDLRLVALLMAEVAAEMAAQRQGQEDLPDVVKTREAFERVRAQVEWPVSGANGSGSTRKIP